MLTNYTKDQWGVVHQTTRSKFVYDKSYVEQRYQPIPQLVQQISHLRLGYVMGSVTQRPQRILDVGFGTGDFLKTCAKLGMITSGCDLYSDFLPENTAFVEHPTQGQYDVITFFDSLEHFETLDWIRDLDTKWVVISLPWCHYPHDDMWFESWKHRKPDEHLHHFNHHSLQSWMASQGYRCENWCNVEDVIRMPVDNLPNILTATFEKNS